MNCPCDAPDDPTPPMIAAGLDDLPRQWSTFIELRLAMLDRARLQPALAEWSARAKDDYGVMWLELWAYIGELLSLYDKAIADESYVRTSKLRPSLRRLVELLGYVPRPAMAATVELAVRAGGRAPVTLPIGTGFRSGAFDGEPPQVFELIAPAAIHPALNQWPVITPAGPILSGGIDELLLEPQTASAAVGDTVLVELGDTIAEVRTVIAVARRVDDAGRRVVAVKLDRKVDAGAGVAVATARLRKASRTAPLQLPSAVGGDTPSFGVTYGYWFVLDGVYRELRQNDRFFIRHGDEVRWATAHLRDDWWITQIAAATSPAVTINLPDSKTATVPAQPIPAVKALRTFIITGDPINDPSRKATPTSVDWTAATDVGGFTIGLGLISAGRVLGATVRAIGPGDPLIVKGARAPVGSTAATTRMLLRDVEQRAVAIGASIDLTTGVIDPAADATWSPGLATPITAYGNVVTAVRGESVTGEVLGSGDAIALHQRFVLAKKPLTYRAIAADPGFASSLRIWVGGLEWFEVTSFFGSRPDDQVFVVRQDDDGASAVTFGDGVRGSRLPSGAAVVASYRFGAGAKAPPAGSIAQLARPVPGLDAVAAALAAGGGADAEDAGSLRELAPRSALLLGRAISIADLEVAARLGAGVVTARADWAWDGTQQRPVVKVWVVTAPHTADVIATVVAQVDLRLRGLSAPDTPITCAAATALSASLAIDLEIDPRRIPDDVVAAVTASLHDDLLAPARLGIATPLLRSPLLAALLDHPGVTGVRGLSWNGAPLVDYGVDPGPGNFFDLTGGLAVTGSH